MQRINTLEEDALGTLPWLETNMAVEYINFMDGWVHLNMRDLVEEN